MNNKNNNSSIDNLNLDDKFIKENNNEVLENKNIQSNILNKDDVDNNKTNQSINIDNDLETKLNNIDINTNNIISDEELFQEDESNDENILIKNEENISNKISIYSNSEIDEYNENNEDNKKNSKINSKAYISIISALGVGVSSYLGFEFGNEIREENQRILHINTSDLDLQLIVDGTDDVGNSQYQLNWKEVCAILGVLKNNYTNEISRDDIINIGQLFIDKDNNSIKTFDKVLSLLDLSENKINRANNYLKDLEHYGFIADRLNPSGEQMTFINSIKDIAIENYYESKILPSITIAQAILESNWGKSSLATEANNLFGIKADRSWKGEYAVFDTREFHDIYIKDKFRKYDTLEESIKDHSTFLMKHDRYTEHKVFEARTYKEQALALENAGYSTAEDEFGNKIYAKMLGEIIRQYNLQIIDSTVVNKK